VFEPRIEFHPAGIHELVPGEDKGRDVAMVRVLGDHIHLSSRRGMDCFASLAMTMWEQWARQINATGKSLQLLSIPSRKNIPLANQ
jgi:hypothetical protein